MCYACYMDHDDDGGIRLPAPAPHPETDRLVELIGRLYDLPECGAGGPLHCELDDWNLHAEVITPMYKTPWRPDNWSPRVHAICDEIAAIMNCMTEEQREYALAIHEGFQRK